MSKASRTHWTRAMIQLREVLEITGLPHGLIKGWEQRGLWKYNRPERGTGKWRWYSLLDVLGFALAGELTKAGIRAADAWTVVNHQVGYVAAGLIKYVAISQDREYRPGHAPYFQYNGLQSLRDLDSVMDPNRFVTLTDEPGKTRVPELFPVPTVVIVVNVAEIKRRILDRIERYFSAREKLSDEELLTTSVGEGELTDYAAELKRLAESERPTE